MCVRIQRDDMSCPDDPGRLNGVDADAADAHHHHSAACRGLTGVDRAAVSGGHTATNQRRLVEWNALVDLHHRCCGHDGVLRKRSEQTHLAHVAAAGMESVRAVQLWTLEQVHSEFTEVADAA